MIRGERGVLKSYYIGENCQETGGTWAVCRFKRGRGVAKMKGAMFLRVVVRVNTPMHTMNLAVTLNVILIY